jgi:hypothetical protein
VTGTSVPIPFKRARAIFLDRVRLDTRLTLAARSVCTEILLRLKHEGDAAYPSHGFLTDKLGISYRSVKRAVAEIEKFGVLEVEHRRVYQGQKNYYRAPAIAAIMHQGQAATDRSASLGVPTSGAPTGATTGAKSAFHRGQKCISQGPKVTPDSSINYSSGESLHQHDHPHPAGGSQNDNLKQAAAQLTNDLLELAGIKKTICAEPAFTRREYDLVTGWLSAGWNPTEMLRSAELQMARRRKSGLVEPLRTLGYFEPEFRKVLRGIGVERHSPRATASWSR